MTIVKLILITAVITFFVVGVIHAYIMLGKSHHGGEYLARFVTALMWPFCFLFYTGEYVYKRIKRKIETWKTKE